jgi:hypothetical protein
VRPDDLAPDERAILERLAKRRGTTIEKLSEILLAQAHWPALVEANLSARAFMQFTVCRCSRSRRCTSLCRCPTRATSD